VLAGKRFLAALILVAFTLPEVITKGTPERIIRLSGAEKRLRVGLPLESLYWIFLLTYQLIFYCLISMTFSFWSRAFEPTKEQK
jgi:hypothetical protein